jgi:hypothetical protein
VEGELQCHVEFSRSLTNIQTIFYYHLKKQVHCKDFPVLGLLARDYLACPASSASVERTFSAAAQVCATGRSGLAVRTIDRCISSQMWLCNGVRMGGTFKDCQDVIDAARKNPKFKKYQKKKKN